MSTKIAKNFIDRDFPVYSSIQSGTGQIVNPHYHDEAELILMLSGNADVYIDTVKFECKQNDLIFIPSYCVHHLIANSSDTSIIGVVFNYKLINNNYIFDASLERISIDFRFGAAVIQSFIHLTKVAYVIKTARCSNAC